MPIHQNLITPKGWPWRFTVPVSCLSHAGQSYSLLLLCMCTHVCMSSQSQLIAHDTGHARYLALLMQLKPTTGLKLSLMLLRLSNKEDACILHHAAAAHIEAHLWWLPPD